MGCRQRYAVTFIHCGIHPFIVLVSLKETYNSMQLEINPLLCDNSKIITLAFVLFLQTTKVYKASIEISNTTSVRLGQPLACHPYLLLAVNHICIC